MKIMELKRYLSLPIEWRSYEREGSFFFIPININQSFSIFAFEHDSLAESIKETVSHEFAVSASTQSIIIRF